MERVSLVGLPKKKYFPKRNRANLTMLALEVVHTGAAMKVVARMQTDHTVVVTGTMMIHTPGLVESTPDVIVTAMMTMTTMVGVGVGGKGRGKDLVSGAANLGDAPTVVVILALDHVIVVVIATNLALVLDLGSGNGSAESGSMSIRTYHFPCTAINYFLPIIQEA